MIVWVNVWGKVLDGRLRIVAVALALCPSACIDDFDHPEGYGLDGSNGGGSSVNGYDCVDLCRQSCEGTDPLDCESQCDQVESLVNLSHCDGSYRAALRCISRLHDPCSEQDVCSDEIDDFSTCVARYCQTRPNVCGSF